MKNLNKKYSAYKASYAQERIWFLEKLEKGRLHNHIGTICRFKGFIRLEDIEKIVKIIIDRHEILRTNFRETETGELVQLIKDEGVSLIKNFDLRNLERAEQTKQEDLIIKTESESNFDLTNDQLIRFIFIRLSEDEYIFLVVGHHIIADAWSMSIAANEFFCLAQALFFKQEPVLPPLLVQYKDYAAWEKEDDFKQKINQQEKYWLKKLSGNLPILDLPTDYPRPHIQTYDTEVGTLQLDGDTHAFILEYCQKNNVTPYIFLLAIFNVLLHKLSGQNDILVGTYAAKRDLPELDNVIGLFLNNLVIRSQVDFESSFSYYLDNLKETVVEAMENKEYPFETLLEKINPPRDMSRSPLFNVSFQFFNSGGNRGLKDNIFYNYIKKYETFDKTLGQYDLSVHVHDRQDDYLFVLSYNRRLFKASTIERLLDYIKEILLSIKKDDSQAIVAINILPETEKELLINKYNQNDFVYDKSKNIYQFFCEQVEKSPNSLAVSCNEIDLSYLELFQRAESLTVYFTKCGIRKNDVVGVFLERSLDYLISILATWKIGAVCVPLVPDEPLEKISFIVKDTEMKFIVTKNNEIKFNESIRLINLKNYKNTFKNSKRILKPNSLGGGSDTAVIIYTSGSTGRPKGVPLSHQGLINQAWGKIKFLNLTPEDVVAQNLSFCFVASIWQFLSPLFIGAQIVIYQQETCSNPLALFSRLAIDRISVWETSPTMLKIFVLAEQASAIFSEKLRIILTGEDTPQQLVKKYYSIYDFHLINAYGQTECSDDTLMYDIVKSEDVKVLLGYPLINTQVYVLGKRQELLPFNVVGELYISGDGLSSGYLKQKEQTNICFLQHPFYKDRYIYRTGDMAKRLEDGTLEYLGRKDSQVKIRGRRIELKEIENVLLNYELINNCLVLAENKKIVVYYTANREIMVQDLRTYLARFFPKDVLPTYFIFLKSFPVNINGKIDKLGLPKAKETEIMRPSYEACLTTAEKDLARIWQTLLRVKKVGRNDDFFELGGYSILAAQVVNKLRGKGYEISLSDVFVYSRLRDLAGKLLNKNEENKIYGGVPMTAVGDWIRKNSSNQAISTNYIFQALKIVDKKIFDDAIDQLRIEYANIKISADTEFKPESDILRNQKVVFENLLSEDLAFRIILNKRKLFLLIARNKVTISASLFTELLLRWQEIYNLKLAGIEDEKIFTPFSSYPDYYHCLHANLLEKIYYSFKRLIPQSIVPAYDYFLLPNYFVVDDSTRRDNDFNAFYLGNIELFISANKFNLKVKIVKLKNAELAEKYFYENSSSQSLLLMGNNYYLPSSPYYKNSEFLSSLKEKRNLLPMNFSIFQSANNKIIVSSLNLNYFGAITKEDFLNYWKNFKHFNELENKYLPKNDLSYQILELSNLLDLKSFDIDMLYEALNMNVMEYLRGQVINGNKSKGFKKIYFGNKVIPQFKNDVIKNINNNKLAISDIVIIDMLKRIQKPFLFLHDLLQDISSLNDDFSCLTSDLAEIIRISDTEFERLYKLSKKNKIKYEPILTYLPSEQSKKLKFLLLEDKNELVKVLDTMQNLHLNLFKNLSIVLQKVIKK